ncbi:MAG: hypothetical protein KDD61_00955 [Bdellovibrionales bacterium]|nr:hypothetical protein [Bdellovibrionales bacterium]
MPFTVKNGKAIAMGDIFLGRTVDSTIEAGHFKPSALKIWPQSIIPFVIEEGLDEALILQAITKINAASPVRWVPRPSGAPYFVGFFKGEEPELCLSQLGFQGVKETPQPIYLGENCGVKEILHELLHTMGLVHEHSRPDRDNWIQVHWENIPEEFHSQFAKVSPLWAPKAVLQEFDYNSLMLYTPYTFSISSSLPAISSRIEGKSLHLKAPVDLSEGDLLKLNRLYKK